MVPGEGTRGFGRRQSVGMSAAGRTQEFRTSRGDRKHCVRSAIPSSVGLA